MFAKAVNNIDWSTESYITSELRFKCPAPLLVRVTQGHCGTEDEDSLGLGQVIRIHRWLTQRRVIAVDSRGRSLSIPLDLNIPFEVLPERKRSLAKRKTVTMTLSDVIRQYPLPKKVRFSPSHLTPDQALESDRLGVRLTNQPLELIRQHEDVYLSGNAINFGELDPSTLSIPVHHDMEMSLALGLKSGRKNWDRLMQELDNVVAMNVRFHDVQGNQKITIYSPEMEDGSVTRKQIVKESVIQKGQQSLVRSYGTLRRNQTEKETRKRAYSVAGNPWSFAHATKPASDVRSTDRRFLKHHEVRRKQGVVDAVSISGTSTSATSQSESTADETDESSLFTWPASEADFDDDVSDITDEGNEAYQVKALFGPTSRLFRPQFWNAHPDDNHSKHPGKRRTNKTSGAGSKFGAMKSISMPDISGILEDLRKQPPHQRGLPPGQDTEEDMDDVDESTDL